MSMIFSHQLGSGVGPGLRLGSGLLGSVVLGFPPPIKFPPLSILPFFFNWVIISFIESSAYPLLFKYFLRTLKKVKKILH